MFILCFLDDSIGTACATTNHMVFNVKHNNLTLRMRTTPLQYSVNSMGKQGKERKKQR